MLKENRERQPRNVAMDHFPYINTIQDITVQKSYSNAHIGNVQRMTERQRDSEMMDGWMDI